jgi:hypothetical protein
MAFDDLPVERTELERRIVARALAEPEFRARLLENPRETLAEELGFELPQHLKVDVFEERPDRLVVVLPVDLSGIGHDGAWAMTGVRPGGPSTARKQG